MPLTETNKFIVPGSLYIERLLPKTGPSPLYLCWRPSISAFGVDAKAVLRFARWPASTPTGASLREWLKASPEPAVPEPNDNTKTII